MAGSAARVTAPSTNEGRPVAITIVAGVAVIAAAYLLVDGALTLLEAGGETDQIVDGIVHVGLGLLALVIAVGAFRMRAWAWKLFMTVAVVGLTIQILRHFFFGDPRYGRMALNTFVVLALTPRDVQVAFGIRAPPNAELDRPTRNPLDRD